jgi:hypothetical protein
MKTPVQQNASLQPLWFSICNPCGLVTVDKSQQLVGVAELTEQTPGASGRAAAR